MKLNAKQVVKLFWEEHPDLPNKRTVDFGTGRKHYPTDTRCAFVEFVDYLHRNGDISDQVAQKVTLP
jgi:hypothetical protein